MVFRKLKAAFGAGVSVDTVLSDSHVYPGGVLRGEVRFTGGGVDYNVQGITLELNAVVEVERGDNKVNRTFDFHRAEVSGPFELKAGASHTVPFKIGVPWATPVSSMGGRRLNGMQLGVATELKLEGALDKGDLDPLVVEPLPVQAAVLDAIAGLGFTFKRADLEAGRVKGSKLPFYQEIEYRSGGEFKQAFKELELTFVSSKANTKVMLEVDKPGGLLTSGGDAHATFTLDNDDTSDPTAKLRSKLKQLAKRRGLFSL